MITQHFRAKYSLEQYPVVFSFPGNVLGFPDVTVEVVSGEDPNAVSFAGFPAVFDNLVSVIVVGGVPGVIYKLICVAVVGDDTLTKVGLIAVKPTLATEPPGTAVPIPFTAVVTTPPYPILVTEELQAVAALSDITLRDTVVDVTEEVVYLGVTPSLVSLVFRSGVIDFETGPESIALTQSLVAMSLRNALISFNAPDEDLGLHPSLEAMTLRIALIIADPGIEELGVTPSLVGMSLYVP